MFDAKFNPQQMAQLLADVKAFEPKLATKLRRNLRAVGDATIAVMRGKLAEAPPGGGGYDVGVRAGISSGIRTQVMTGKTRQGIRLSATSSKLPAERKAMLRAYNKSSFRHPLWGNLTYWREEPGRPFFGSSIKGKEAAMFEAVQEALSEALKEISR